MSTETADIERMARDILIAAGGKSWDYTGDFERQHALTIARSLHSLGYKPSIVHECCVTAQQFKEAIVEEAEILGYAVLTSEGGICATFDADEDGRKRATATVAAAWSRKGRFQVGIITALPQDGEP